MSDEALVIGSSRSPLVLEVRARHETVDTILAILDEAVMKLSEISGQAPEKSIDRTLIQVATATLVRTLSVESLSKMEQRIIASYAGK